MRGRTTVAAVIVMATLLVLACEPERVVIESGTAGFEGYHVGYSWSGEARGTELADAGAFIETILQLDEDGVIQDASMRYWQRADGYWTTRQSAQAHIQVDFSAEPSLSTIGSEYQPGTSMFSMYTVNMMSLYAAAVNQNGVAAVAIVEPLTRFQFEARFPAGFDYSTPVRELTIGNGTLLPTIRTSGGGMLAPDSWDEIADMHIFNLHTYSHVMNDTGIFADIDGDSTARELLQAMGISFSGGQPEPSEVQYGRFGLGGWPGNYDAIAEYLIGRNARDFTSLVNYEPERYSEAINDQNQFGVDVATGATRTVQNSVDGISGATVRMSRESASYQRALVDAGIIAAEDVIIGRF